jgi:hypothetical protein
VYCTVFVTVYIFKYYSVLDYRLSAFRPRIRRRITAVTLFLTLALVLNRLHMRKQHPVRSFSIFEVYAAHRDQVEDHGP